MKITIPGILKPSRISLFPHSNKIFLLNFYVWSPIFTKIGSETKKNVIIFFSGLTKFDLLHGQIFAFASMIKDF